MVFVKPGPPASPTIWPPVAEAGHVHAFLIPQILISWGRPLVSPEYDFIYKFGQGASIRDVSNNKIKITVKFTEKNIQKE